MKKRRKHKECLNCGYLLKDEFNFCPDCGQENTDNEVGIGLLLREFTSNFFSLDSRFGRTLQPFLFKPGRITSSFNQGMRVFYANPIRWYLVISIFHFFFFVRVIDPSETTGRSFVVGDELTEAEFDSLYYLPDSLHDQDDWPLPEHYFEMINYLNQDSELSPTEVMDSLKLTDLPFAKRIATKQIIKINHESSASLVDYILQQIPIIMFFILPAYAFILKIFFWRKGLYIRHLVHSLHIHSFFFFVLGIGWILTLILGSDYQNTITGIAMLISAAYILISFKNIYQVKWGWTVVRFFLVGYVYSIVLTISLVFGLLFSLVFF